MSAIGPDLPPETNANEEEHRGQLARSARSASERLDGLNTRVDDLEARVFDLEQRMDVVETLTFTREFDFTVRNNQDRDITQSVVAGSIVSFRYFALDGQADCELRINDTPVTSSPASPVTVPPGSWVPVTATGANTLAVGDNISVFTTAGSNNDEMIISITIDPG